MLNLGRLLIMMNMEAVQDALSNIFVNESRCKVINVKHCLEEMVLYYYSIRQGRSVFSDRGLTSSKSLRNSMYQP